MDESAKDRHNGPSGGKPAADSDMLSERRDIGAVPTTPTTDGELAARLQRLQRNYHRLCELMLSLLERLERHPGQAIDPKELGEARALIQRVLRKPDPAAATAPAAVPAKPPARPAPAVAAPGPAAATAAKVRAKPKPATPRREPARATADEPERVLGMHRDIHDEVMRQLSNRLRW